MDEGTRIVTVIVGIVYFCFGLPFTAAPLLIYIDLHNDVDSLGELIFPLAFSTPFFLFGIVIIRFALKATRNAIWPEDSTLKYGPTAVDAELNTMDVEVGPIWSHDDYLERKDREWANAIPGWELTGHWRTTIPGQMSVVGYRKTDEEGS